MIVWFQETWAGLSWWDALGGAGQLVFASRFIVQWIASERRRESHVPVAFWYLSIVGSLMCLVYSIHVQKVPFILGYLFNCIPYVRNLMLQKKPKEAAA